MHWINYPRPVELEPEWYLNEDGVLVQDTEPVVKEWRPQPRVLPKKLKTAVAVRKSVRNELHQMMQNKVAVELELMRRRHLLQRQYYADQLKLQQGAEIAALQLQQNITKKEMDLWSNQKLFRGKQMLLPNVNVAFGVASLDTYSTEGCSPNNPIVFES